MIEELIQTGSQSLLSVFAPAIAFSAISAVLWAIIRLVKNDPKKAQYKTIPGPKGLIPWIGPIFQMPSTDVYKKFAEWHDEYGPIYQLTLFGTKHVRINSEKMAQDILAKRGSHYSNRAPTPNIPGAKTDAEYLPLLDNNEALTRHRKFAHECLAKTYNYDMYGFTHVEIKRMMYLLKRDNRNYPRLAEEFTHRVSARLAWEDPTLSIALNKSSSGLLSAISPSGQLPNKVPIIMLLPNVLNPWYWREKKRHDAQREFWVGAMQAVKAKMEAGIDGHSWSRTFLQEQERLKFPSGVQDDKEGAFAVGMLAITASLPMSSPIQTYFLAMCHYPQWQKKLQEEIDEVCGPNRLPTWADAPKLPILRAVGKELIRWRPPVPTGVPHEAERDDVYDGYLIEKGTLVHPTEWARRSDEALYPNPEEFNPDRYLNPKYPTYKEPLTKYPNVINHHVFGYGRRNCMGMEIVDYQLVTIMGSLAWAFNVSKKKNKIGVDIPVHVTDWTDLLITRPRPFVFDIKPRDEHKAKLVDTMFEEAVMESADVAI
ncbi:hypothetical protein COCCADRAFT_35011 [Bipolaris zeicola 26-R-13]|uniref:Cytochrome P450 n=1 Tax=Cochliobolus carbonum (strain 26-R-13) TaxID=930089 RepID=W6YCY5_COCC2|nr:uncharacterized protein COCCADRAFT_35011 [Bipolaris zeicola 26-R-13]EUC35508.1 hypothetical protein COCCADRAFT_35011 [Bipolaris zeicola 26-R-13]